ncbi:MULTISPECIES: tyrosine-type recombinase/integrase [Bacillus cereus group]|uniref:tyrosine-type recombinase/integrase n=1 Tax=Bacillus cereus group TaxID=86661 RepID=UPI001F37AC05|nr:tyrosine-type recombinase/integrase [Bacillus mycoides]
MGNKKLTFVLFIIYVLALYNEESPILNFIAEELGSLINFLNFVKRHSYATYMINNGAPLEVIKSLLGHEKNETTRIFAQLSGKLRHNFYIKYF